MNAHLQRRTHPCADCSVSTVGSEYFMVHDGIWEQAWAGRRKSPRPPATAGLLDGVITARDGRTYGVVRDHTAEDHEFLCIGCLEQRIGRTLIMSDFTDARVNDPNHPVYGRMMSERLRHRLRAVVSSPIQANE